MNLVFRLDVWTVTLQDNVERGRRAPLFRCTLDSLLLLVGIEWRLPCSSPGHAPEHLSQHRTMSPIWFTGGSEGWHLCWPVWWFGRR